MSSIFLAQIISIDVLLEMAFEYVHIKAADFVSFFFLKSAYW